MIGIDFAFPWEVPLMVFLQTNLLWFAPFLSACSIFAEQVVSVVILGFFFWCYDKKLGKTMGLVISLGIFSSALIKNSFIRRRPYFDHEEIKCLRPAESAFPVNDVVGQGFSFPSSHATNSVAIFGSLILYFRKKWITILCLVIILLVGLSRIFIGVHYPTDVLTGWAVAIISILVVFILQAKIKKQWIIYLIFILLGFFGFVFSRTPDYYRAFGILIGIVASLCLDDYYTHFENTRNIGRMIIRFIGGLFFIGVPFIICKLVFPTGSDIVSYMGYILTYAIPLILSFGIYPLLFKRFDKYFDK